MKELIQNNLGTIVNAIVMLITAYFSYNQYTKNKETDRKIAGWKKGEELRKNMHIENMATIYAEMHRLLHDLKVDRVYILQPHPLINNLFVTISMEVKRKGISPMKGQVFRKPMSEIASIIGTFSKESWLHSDNVEMSGVDKIAKSIMGRNGTTQVLVKRLADTNDRWIGNLFLENTTSTTLNVESISEVQEEVQEAANNIQFILPEYNDPQQCKN